MAGDSDLDGSYAKFFAIYDALFWRANGLSGTAQNMAVPMVEIHATTASGKAAFSALWAFRRKPEPRSAKGN